jgi:CheY-like chemotaxis protein
MPKALVVEDEAIAAMAISLMLESIGLTVVGVAVSGQEAMDIAAEYLPDVILMDIRLKGEMSGIDSAKAIQSRLRIPIIFTTAYSAEELRENCDVDDGFLFVTKPIREDELAQAVSAACGQGRTVVSR